MKMEEPVLEPEGIPLKIDGSLAMADAAFIMLVGLPGELSKHTITCAQHTEMSRFATLHDPVPTIDSKVRITCLQRNDFEVWLPRLLWSLS